MATGAYWWGLSPYNFDYNAYVRSVTPSGSDNTSNVSNVYGLRFVVSLGSGAVISSGNGSEESPFVISE